MDAELVEHIKADIGFFLPEWTVEFRPWRANYGTSNSKIKRIRLSKYLIERGSIVEIRDTMLHEVAHGLVGGEHGHDSVWQEMAKSLGATPASRSINHGELPHKYELRCPNCPSYNYRLNRRGKWYNLAMRGNAQHREDNVKLELWDVERNVKLN